MIEEKRGFLSDALIEEVGVMTPYCGSPRFEASVQTAGQCMLPEYACAAGPTEAAYEPSICELLMIDGRREKIRPPFPLQRLRKIRLLPLCHKPTWNVLEAKYQRCVELYIHGFGGAVTMYAVMCQDTRHPMGVIELDGVFLTGDVGEDAVLRVEAA
jgi:hypothetical protein